MYEYNLTSTTCAHVHHFRPRRSSLLQNVHPSRRSQQFIIVTLQRSANLAKHKQKRSRPKVLTAVLLTVRTHEIAGADVRPDFKCRKRPKARKIFPAICSDIRCLRRNSSLALCDTLEERKSRKTVHEKRFASRVSLSSKRKEVCRPTFEKITIEA